MSTTPTTSNLVPKRFWSQMAWQYLTVAYHGYHKGWEAYLLWKSSLKDHASNAAESVDTNLRGLSFFGFSFWATWDAKDAKHIKTPCHLWKALVILNFGPWKTLPGTNFFIWLWTFLVLRSGKKHAMLDEGDWNSRYSQNIQRNRCEIVHNQSINNSMRNADNHAGQGYAL